MPDVVIVEAVRTPVGRRGGGLSTMHPADLLATVQHEVIQRAGIDPAEVGQVVGGCVSQVGEQAFNITRTAWLTAGLPLSVAATTVDSQCGSSQQATNFATSLVGAGVVDAAIACGVEVMSRVPLGASGRASIVTKVDDEQKITRLGVPTPKSYFGQYEMTSQFEGAERIADKWGITRADCDEFGLRSQTRAAQAWAEGRFDTQLIPVDAPDLDDEGKPTGTTHRVERDEGPRESTLEGLAALKPVARPEGVHTAGSSSQISDGAAAVLIMTREKADALGLRPRARIVDTCLVGVDPVLMLTGPIDATQHLLARTGMKLDDIDLTEINEAFASVALAWERELGADPERTNPNGGAVALGHPLGGTGAILMTKALHELERRDAHQRAHHDVLRRRPRDRHHHRAPVALVLAAPVRRQQTSSLERRCAPFALTLLVVAVRMHGRHAASRRRSRDGRGRPSTATRSTSASTDGASESACSASTRPRRSTRPSPSSASGPRRPPASLQLLPAGTTVALDPRRRGARRLRAAPRLRPPRRCVRQPAPRRGGLRRNARHQAQLDARPAAVRGCSHRTGAAARPVGCVRQVASPPVTTLAERLGYGSDARLLIINCDDLGACHAANVGTYEALREGIATSASLMVPCPWAREAAVAVPGRGRRRAPHAQRGVRPLPLGTDHTSAVAARR